MTVGPLELVVLGFEGDSFKGHIAAELDKVVKRDIINLVDLVFVRKDREGEVTVSEIQDLRDTDAKRYAGIVGDVMGLLTDEDLSKVGDELEPATAAAVILFEHTWAVGLKEAIEEAGGSVIARKRISQEALDELNAEMAAAMPARGAAG
ncbi:MAG: hypothetical protein E6G44_06395 [Actinobacteria bacterium]|nr:MAG: hypothetical protein E6G44_06395 [Actinomycetota bacterium]